MSGADDAVGLLEGIWPSSGIELRDVRSGIAVTSEGDGHDADRGELWFAGETGEAVLLELDGRRRALADEAAELAARADAAAREADEATARASEAEASYSQVAHLRGATLDVELLARLAAVADGLAAETERASTAWRGSRLPSWRGWRRPTGARTELGDELRRIAGIEAEARRDASDAARRASETEVVLARLGGAPIGVGAAADRPREDLAAEAVAALAEADRAASAARAAADAARAADAVLVERCAATEPSSTSISSGGSSTLLEPSGRRSTSRPRWRRASRRPFGRGSTRVPRARASSARSCVGWVRPSSSCARQRRRQPSA